MLKILKKILVFIIDWLPIFFYWWIIYLTPSIYIREIPIFISQKSFFIIIHMVILLWLVFTSLNEEYKSCIQKLIDSLVPIELICYVFFLEYRFKYAIVIVVLFGVINVSAMYTLIKKNRVKSLTRKQWHKYIIVFKRLSSFLIILLFTIPSIFSIFVYGLRQPYSVATVSKEIFSQTSFESLAIKNETTLKNLLDSKWDNLSHEEKMNTLQTIVNIETSYLTINPITLKSTKLEKNTLGKYSHNENTIYISSEFLETGSSLNAINIICHECRHAYQYYVVNMLDWSQDSVNSNYFYRSAQQWRLELKNYRDAYIDKYSYYQQNVERDARAYAKRGVQAYIEFLEKNYSDN